jgi:hypothetical protein
MISRKRRRSSNPSLERIDEVQEAKTPRLIDDTSNIPQNPFLDESYLDCPFAESSHSDDEDECSRSFSLEEYDAAKSLSLLRQDLPMSRPQTPEPGAVSSSSSSFDSDEEGDSEADLEDEDMVFATFSLLREWY